MERMVLTDRAANRQGVVTKDELLQMSREKTADLRRKIGQC